MAKAHHYYQYAANATPAGLLLTTSSGQRSYSFYPADVNELGTPLIAHSRSICIGGQSLIVHLSLPVPRSRSARTPADV